MKIIAIWYISMVTLCYNGTGESSDRWLQNQRYVLTQKGADSYCNSEKETQFIEIYQGTDVIYYYKSCLNAIFPCVTDSKSYSMT